VKPPIAFVSVLLVMPALGAAEASASPLVAPPLPTSIAAIGDSMTQAADVCCFYGDHPHKSWSTGDDPSDPTSSHYERIRNGNPGIWGNNLNDSVSGAKMIDAAGQASQAVSQQAQYVTILMGANDLCTSTIEGMTSVEDFRVQFQSAMAILETGLPSDAHIFVGSIPNVYRLWSLFRGNRLAQLIWGVAGLCQSMLSRSNTEADRQVVLQREMEFNAVLAEVCAQHANCRYDGGAVFAYVFTGNDVSKLDYYHPSLAGQAVLAEVTWEASWWGGL
jgi:lysophospholipase L1-like esterase